MTSDPNRTQSATLPSRKIPLGEELPIFCEHCGYALHGLPQNICQHCNIRQFHCPECGHHQPINTLRPAAQKILGRLRAFCLAFVVFFKINFFGWLLFAWSTAGYGVCYRYVYNAGYLNDHRPLLSEDLSSEMLIPVTLFALFFSMTSRMLLLRWKRGYLIGLILSALVCLVMLLGAKYRQFDEGRFDRRVLLPSPITPAFALLLLYISATLTLGAATAWGIWSALATLFLPKRASTALLNWQRTQSDPPAATLARE